LESHCEREFQYSLSIFRKLFSKSKWPHLLTLLPDLLYSYSDVSWKNIRNMLGLVAIDWNILVSIVLTIQNGEYLSIYNYQFPCSWDWTSDLCSYKNKKQEENLLSALDQNAVPKVEEENFIDHSCRLKYVALMLQPPYYYESHKRRFGYQGNGKTNFVQKIKYRYAGVIYLNVVPCYMIDKSFILTFAKASYKSPYWSNWIKTIASILLLTSRSKEGKLYQIHSQL